MASTPEGEAAHNIGLWRTAAAQARPAVQPKVSKIKSSVDVAIPNALVGLIHWAAAEPSRRKVIDPALECVGARCQGRLLISALKAFGVRQRGDGMYEISEDPAHNRFELQRSELRAKLQAEHAAGMHVLRQRHDLLLQQATGAISHLQAQLADAHAALAAQMDAAYQAAVAESSSPAACLPAARSPATGHPIVPNRKRRLTGVPRSPLEIEQAAEIERLRAALACGNGDLPLLPDPAVPDANPQMPQLKAVRLNASEHAHMMYRVSCERREWASPPPRRSAGLGERVPPRTR